MSAKNKQWLQDYTKLLNTPPGPDDVILGSVPESGIFLRSILKDGQPPFITASLYLPEIVGAELRWMASSSDETVSGMSCIIGPRTRADLLRKYGAQDHYIVKSIRIQRLSKSGKSYVVEVNEYMDTPVAEPEEAAAAS